MNQAKPGAGRARGPGRGFRDAQGGGPPFATQRTARRLAGRTAAADGTSGWTPGADARDIRRTSMLLILSTLVTFAALAAIAYFLS